jgi:hypothetical protein
MSTNNKTIRIVETINNGKHGYKFIDTVHFVSIAGSGERKEEYFSPFLGNMITKALKNWPNTIILDMKGEQHHTKLQIDNSDRPTGSYDSYDIWEGQVKYLMEEEKMSEEEAQKSASNDEFIYQDSWECLKESLWEVLEKLSPDGNFIADGRDMGWRGLSGNKAFYAEDVDSFIQEMFPKCDFSIWFWDYEDQIQFRVSHHDAPTGERYVVRKGECCERCGEIVPAIKDFPGLDYPICKGCYEELLGDYIKYPENHEEGLIGLAKDLGNMLVKKLFD